MYFTFLYTQGDFGPLGETGQVGAKGPQVTQLIKPKQ